MPYIKADKSKWIEESYTPDWEQNFIDTTFNPEEIPWINAVQLNQDISIET